MITRENAILLRVRMSNVSTSRTDMKATKEVEEKHQLETDTGIYRKNIIRRKDAAEIFSARNSVYQTKMRYTLPWTDGNIRILSSRAFDEFSKELQSAINKVKEDVEKFLSKYNEVKAASKKRLGDLWIEEEFPTKEIFRKSFDIRVSYFPVPDKGDFRTSNKEIIAAFNEDMEEQRKIAQQEIWSRFKEVISHLHEKLSKTDTGFKESTVTKINDLVKLAKVLNMDDDKNIEAFRKQVEDKLTGFTAEDLRSDEALREKKGKETKDLLKKLENYI